MVDQAYFVSQRAAELFGSRRRVCQEGLSGAIHKGDRQHDGLLRFGGLAKPETETEEDDLI